MSRHIRVPKKLYRELEERKREGDTFADVIDRHVSEDATVWEESELRELAREEAHTVIQQEARR